MADELQYRLVKFVNTENLSEDQRVEFLDDLYWADWSALEDNSSVNIDSLLKHLESEDLTIREISKVLPLYNNLDGVYTKEFADIIANLYKKDRIKFFQALK